MLPLSLYERLFRLLDLSDITMDGMVYKKKNIYLACRYIIHSSIQYTQCV